MPRVRLPAGVHAFSDGLSAGEWEKLQATLGDTYKQRLTYLARAAGIREATIAAVTLAFSMTLIPAGPAAAGLISTDRVIEQERVSSERDRVASFVARDDVRNEFQKHGVNPDEAAARVAALSDFEIGQIAAKLDSLPPARTRPPRSSGRP